MLNLMSSHEQHRSLFVLRSPSYNSQLQQNLLSLQGGIATLIETDGARRRVAAHALRPGDRLLVATGERVAADGIILAGKSEIDQSLITGETAPVAAAPGAEIYAGTLNLGQPLEVEVTDAADATLLAEIGRLMLAAEQGKARQLFCQGCRCGHHACRGPRDD